MLGGSADVRTGGTEATPSNKDKDEKRARATEEHAWRRLAMSLEAALGSLAPCPHLILPAGLFLSALWNENTLAVPSRRETLN